MEQRNKPFKSVHVDVPCLDQSYSRAIVMKCEVVELLVCVYWASNDQKMFRI